MTRQITSTVRIIAAVAGCAVAVQLAASPGSHAATAAAGDVTVTVKYTGKGNVDASHRIWIWAFDSPTIGAGSIPLAEMSVEKNGGEAAFAALSADTVYFAVAYDVAGGFAGSAPPPSGSPVKIHSDAKGVPAPIKPGKAVRVAISFNDVEKMP
jgi:hypothetical protein